jgi:SAM-dependent methyltransferase
VAAARAFDIMCRHYAIKKVSRQEGWMSQSFSLDRIRRYYERHTRAFVTWGEGGSLGALHRAVAAPGVTTKAEAFRHVEERIITLLETLNGGSRSHVVDLGCGVGGSLIHLASRLPISGTGVTLSPTQAALAGERIQRAGLAGRVRVVAGDYTELPNPKGDADLVFAIESFVHAADPARFLAHSVQLLRPGGCLVICDDFRRSTSAPAAIEAIDRFRRGWHVNTLLHADELQALAAAAGLTHESTTDLSAYIDIGRPRDRLVDALAAPLEWLPWRWSQLDPWLGGSALQRCLRHGWIGYDFAVFRRAP